eukprot:TRINITY_DN22418_c0_g1_i14.p1 TRINITY_DN22418_c0_g1~~TRINITY_DN22418_c0_g1_i14.p1  ORF type:complete len:126 (+),score=29.76 TRINITY_DN22418_c0_g1_i14:212-589(+)
MMDDGPDNDQEDAPAEGPANQENQAQDLDEQTNGQEPEQHPDSQQSTLDQKPLSIENLVAKPGSTDLNPLAAEFVPPAKEAVVDLDDAKEPVQAIAAGGNDPEADPVVRKNNPCLLYTSPSPRDS